MLWKEGGCGERRGLWWRVDGCRGGGWLWWKKSGCGGGQMDVVEEGRWL